MEETDDSLDDWKDLMLSPTGLLSGFMSESCFSKSISQVLSGESESGTNFVKEVGVFMSNPEANLEDDEIRVGSVVLVDDKTLVNNGGNPADTSMDEFDINDASPCLTIPSGISPNELLDSPVMLPNSQLSPTTGTLDLAPPDDDNPMLKSTSIPADKEQDGDDVSSFKLKPLVNPVSLPCYPPSQNQVSTGDFAHHFRTENDCRSLDCIQPQAKFEFAGQEKCLGVESPADTKIAYEIGMKAESGGFQLSSHSYGKADDEIRESSVIGQLVNGAGHSLDGILKGLYPTMGTTKISEDGYHWRKYGQKQVKGSIHPRSYYKCTHPSCAVKKKVERSHDGHITEIIYKGAHNHPKPQPTRSSRSTFGSTVACDESTEIGEGSGSYAKADPLWREMQQQGSEWKSEGLDITSTTSVLTEVSDPHSSSQKPAGALESAETPELSSTLASHDEEEEDTTTQGSLSVGEDDDIETESKRRKKETSLMETALGSRALREPRVIVQIESEVDIIDDGYRWRKYGQKVVKGNPNPRSYYKCTSAGCTVRKHVERASHNLKYVLTTYEGKHNHVVPAARNSNHLNSAAPSSTSQSSLTLPRNPHLPKAEPQDLVPPFDRKMDYESEFLRSNYLGNFSGATSSLFMKLPSVPTTGLYGGFGLNHNYNSSAPPMNMIPAVRDLTMSFPLSLSFPSSFALPNYNNQCPPSLNPVPSFFMGQQIKENDIKLLRPKQEQRD